MIYDYIEKHFARLARVTRISSVRLRSVLSLAQRCDYAKRHADQVGRLSLQIFDGLKNLHGLSATDRELLYYGALLHDIGYHISYENHHRHAYYLIKNADLNGFSEEEIHLIALTIRYHRGPLPKKNQIDLLELAKPLRRRVEWLSAILRIADSLDRSHFSLVEKVLPKVSKNIIQLKIRARKNPEYELGEARLKGDFLKKISRREVKISR